MNNILNEIFDEVFMEDFVEIIPNIPNVKEGRYSVCWRLVTEIEISHKSTDITLFLGFAEKFPYILPDIFFFDKQFDYFPHIDYTNRKLCLFEEDAIIDNSGPLQLVKSCIRQAKKLIEYGANNLNMDDFIAEIESYWAFSYDKESAVDIKYLVYGHPQEKCLMNILTNADNVKMIVTDGVVKEIKRWFKPYGTIEKILYLPSIGIASRPPYNITFCELMEHVSDDEKKSIITYISRYSSMNILFPLSGNYLFGGYHFGYVNSNVRGFRPGNMSPIKVLKTICKTKNLPRIMAYAYNNTRIEERTSGTIQNYYSFAIIGCGSIGSNLCTFLNSYNKVSLVLVDNDIFSINNIGRHTLGISDVFNTKVEALKRKLLSAKPEMKINACYRNIYDVSPTLFSGCNAIFSCTGNLSAERYLIRALDESDIRQPKFVLWLEPYAIAGHLIYISKYDGYKTFNKCFDDKGIYVHNLITPIEYEHPSSLTKRDAGCNGSYTNYSGNDVMLFLSSMYPIICDLFRKESLSTCYRWVGNIEIATEKGIVLTNNATKKNNIDIFPCQ